MKNLLKLLLPLLFTSWAWGQQTARVVSDNAPLFEAAQPDASEVGHLKTGRNIQTDGRTQNGYLHLITKSGRDLWVRVADTNFADRDALSSDDATPDSRPDPEAYPKFTYDLGGGSGSYNGNNYTEITIGLNTYFREWFAWRNAAFYRFQTGLGNALGLDTSVRGILAVGGRSAGLTLFAGPGYRFMTIGQNAPFVEGGAVVKLAGLAVGIGLKTVFNSAVSANTPNDNQVFLILSGGGSL